MVEFKLNPATLIVGIYILSEINNESESIYLKVREKENRTYSSTELKKLPFASKTNPHKKEWDVRAKSFLRLKKYLNNKKANSNILDLGCGNCWLSGQLSNTFNFNFYCVDVNYTELKQGNAAFENEKIKFIYADIFSSDIPDKTFDIIILNATVQYFPEIKQLLDRLLLLLNNTGEIHFIDSPFYSENEVENARRRTAEYYKSLDFPEMAKKYFHHSYYNLSNFNYKILYNPQSLKSKLFHLLLSKDSPFPWIVIKK